MEAIERAAEGLPDSIAWVTQIASELELTLFDGITTQQLDEAVIQVALQNIKDDPAFDIVAARLLLKTIYKRVLGDYSSADELRRLHQEHFVAYVHRGVDEILLDPRFTELFDLDRLAANVPYQEAGRISAKELSLLVGCQRPGASPPIPETPLEG